jgi:protein tyrosine phosphatase
VKLSQSPLPVMQMLSLMRDLQPDDSAPMIIHCSAGCGRTGSLIAIDYIWSVLKVGRPIVVFFVPHLKQDRLCSNNSCRPCSVFLML